MDKQLNQYQAVFSASLFKHNFVQDKTFDAGKYQLGYTKTLKNQDVIRVVLDCEGERLGCIAYVYVFTEQVLSYQAEFGFGVPKQAILNFIESLG